MLIYDRPKGVFAVTKNRRKLTVYIVESKLLVAYFNDCHTVGNCFVCKQGFKSALVAHDGLFQVGNLNLFASKQVILARVEQFDILSVFEEKSLLILIDNHLFHNM